MYHCSFFPCATVTEQATSTEAEYCKKAVRLKPFGRVRHTGAASGFILFFSMLTLQCVHEAHALHLNLGRVCRLQVKNTGETQETWSLHQIPLQLVCHIHVDEPVWQKDEGGILSSDYSFQMMNWWINCVLWHTAGTVSLEASCKKQQILLWRFFVSVLLPLSELVKSDRSAWLTVSTNLKNKILKKQTKKTFHLSPQMARLVSV